MDGFAQVQKGKMMSDLISRQDAIEAIEKRMKAFRDADCEWAMNARSIRPKAPKSTARMLSVNKCIWEGWTVFDITDSTVTPDRLEEGVVAYNSAGERIVGTAKIVRREEG